MSTAARPEVLRPKIKIEIKKKIQGIDGSAKTLQSPYNVRLSHRPQLDSRRDEGEGALCVDTDGRRKTDGDVEIGARNGRWVGGA